MPSPDIKVRKSLHIGWMAESCSELMPGFILDVSTCKRNGGNVSTYATVHKVVNGFKTHRVYSDFSVRLHSTTVARATEAAIRRVHEDVLKAHPWDELCARAKAHTEALEAKEAGHTHG